MRVISEDGNVNLSFDNRDFEITSPYLIPPMFYIKAVSDHRDIIIASVRDRNLAKFVFDEIQNCNSNGSAECKISEIIERSKTKCQDTK